MCLIQSGTSYFILALYLFIFFPFTRDKTLPEKRALLFLQCSPSPWTPDFIHGMVETNRKKNPTYSAPRCLWSWNPPGQMAIAIFLCITRSAHYATTYSKIQHFPQSPVHPQSSPSPLCLPNCLDSPNCSGKFRSWVSNLQAQIPNSERKRWAPVASALPVRRDPALPNLVFVSGRLHKALG